MSSRLLRALVLLLVAANLGLFAWGRGYFGAAERPEAARLQQQIHPENLYVLGRGESDGEASGGSADSTPVTPAASASASTSTPQSSPPAGNGAISATTTQAQPPSPPPGEAANSEPQAQSQTQCLAWNKLSDANAKRITDLLKSKHPSLKTVVRPNSAAATWWVYIPPLPNRAAAEKKTAELKNLDVPEYFIVQEDGPRRHSISLGIFSNETAARERLKELQNKGVRSARVGPRTYHEGPTKTVEARGGAETVEAARASANTLSPPLPAVACDEAADL